MKSVEIFAGAGGLAIGMANAGFQHVAVIERDHHACQTFRDNQSRHISSLDRWPLHEVDARCFDFSLLPSDIAVVSGGPPCQPFSMGGKHKANDDSRDMFPVAIRAVRELMPQAFIFENVKGLTRQSFSSYFSYIILQLQYPEISCRNGQDWISHHSDLIKYKKITKGIGTYTVQYGLLNAADYGIPQKRERIFFIGFRSDIAVKWSMPEKTHSEESLIVSKWIDGTYWDEHKISVANRTRPSERLTSRIKKLKGNSALIKGRRWRTVRDAFADLPDPEICKNSTIFNHIHTPGARSYPGHTGSLLDEPAKTLKAGHHGVPGGENMFIKDNGEVRYFTVREAARLQTFPDDYELRGSWSQSMRQLGNAVPVKLGQILAESISAALREASAQLHSALANPVILKDVKSYHNEIFKNQFLSSLK
jgi:DNA (cytosine-5)-methyltransferase 1